MKTFLELLATKQEISIDLILEPIKDNGVPWCELIINNTQLYNDLLDKEIQISHTVDLLDNISVSIKMKGKVYSAGKETAIKFKSFTIDNIDIFPYYTSNISYSNDQNNDCKSFYLGFNGTWDYKILMPFYRWYHTASGQGWLLEQV